MLTCDAVKTLIEDGLPGAVARVQNFGGGADHYEAVVVASQFDGLSMVKQHQMVYGTVQPHLQNGTMHALGLKTYTPAEWADRKNNGA